MYNIYLIRDSIDNSWGHGPIGLRLTLSMYDYRDSTMHIKNATNEKFYLSE
jgi:hypothetical protein